ncbi:MAG: hypothetical protein AAF432_13105 [Planctomycetota bacterium]
MGIRKTMFGAVAATTMLVATTADAGFDLSISGLGGPLYSDSSLDAAGTLSIANGTTLSNGLTINEFSSNWSGFEALAGGGGAPDGAFVSMDFVVTNNTAVDQVLVMSASTTLVSPFLGGVVINGSVGFESLGTDVFNPNATVGLNGGSPFYTANIDGSGVQNLVTVLPQNGAFNLFETTESFGVPTPIAGPATANSDISMDIEFLIPAGANISLTSTFNIEAVPAPGALALLGVAGLGARRRRRLG